MKKGYKKTWETPLLLSLNNDNTNAGIAPSTNEGTHFGGTCLLVS
jgi:hypothetical protein